MAIVRPDYMLLSLLFQLSPSLQSNTYWKKILFASTPQERELKLAISSSYGTRIWNIDPHGNRQPFVNKSIGNNYSEGYFKRQPAVFSRHTLSPVRQSGWHMLMKTDKLSCKAFLVISPRCFLISPLRLIGRAILAHCSHWLHRTEEKQKKKPSPFMWSELEISDADKQLKSLPVSELMGSIASPSHSHKLLISIWEEAAVIFKQRTAYKMHKAFYLKLKWQIRHIHIHRGSSRSLSALFCTPTNKETTKLLLHALKARACQRQKI